MDPSSAQSQEMGTNAPSSSLESMLVCPKAAQAESKKARPQPEQALNCPRCDSTNTKFCYYNNYSLSQPRYFCKSCRRYWTKGGTLRNVPVGGGCRKNKRSSSSSSSRRSQQDHHHQPLNLGTTPPPNNNPNNPLSALSSLACFDHNSSNFDLSLGFARLHHHHNKPLLLPDQFDHLSLFGSPNSIHHQNHDVLGNLPITSLNNTPSSSGCYFDSMNSIGFHTNFNNYGLGNGEVESEEMGIPCDHEISTTTTSRALTTSMKQMELCNTSGSNNSNGREDDEQNMAAVWGFPWQNIISTNTGDDGDPELLGRESFWNGMTPSWHNLLNSPLM